MSPRARTALPRTQDSAERVSYANAACTRLELARVPADVPTAADSSWVQRGPARIGASLPVVPFLRAVSLRHLRDDEHGTAIRSTMSALSPARDREHRHGPHHRPHVAASMAPTTTPAITRPTSVATHDQSG
jgi:hypothetical protein